MTIRQMQALSALYLARYCQVLGIEHSSIKQLVDHLFSILVYEDLLEWERKGALLPLTGRGDTFPEGLSLAVGNANIKDFKKLVEYSVEIGIVDLYGAKSTHPYRFLAKCRQILNKRKIDVPSDEMISKIKSINDHYGRAISLLEYDLIYQYYKEILVVTSNSKPSRS